jgi:hypothetical protein
VLQSQQPQSGPVVGETPHLTLHLMPHHIHMIPSISHPTATGDSKVKRLTSFGAFHFACSQVDQRKMMMLLVLLRGIIYIHTYIYIERERGESAKLIYIYIYIYIEREREGGESAKLKTLIL